MRLACHRYGFGAPLYSNEEARGGSAWGAGTLANGDGSRQPSKVELDFAEYQASHAHLIADALLPILYNCQAASPS